MFRNVYRLRFAHTAYVRAIYRYWSKQIFRNLKINIEVTVSLGAIIFLYSEDNINSQDIAPKHYVSVEKFAIFQK